MGNHRFDVQAGLRSGRYSVEPAATTASPVTAVSGELAITWGDIMTCKGSTSRWPERESQRVGKTTVPEGPRST